MAKSKRQKLKPASKKEKSTTITKQPIDESVELFSDVKDSIMPELEELVKKNPNRLIGCGG
ncbi:MAG TPA: hypothetical protein PLJ42_09610 [Chitinophagales bacterium]|jgi:hypothetical protein|nr:hypothetical protein [Chitinophagales bacterium]MBP6154617.1 hypothetical protein [Chitinophagales bacterium]HQV77179.1 hypothetical protein [Chitinophagales bacterium]HQW79678.1 hypothetical protein [Chitinophagales bacterium]HRB67036.1 hypothetical protein [Chitinophagales bacterium]